MPFIGSVIITWTPFVSMLFMPYLIWELNTFSMSFQNGSKNFLKKMGESTLIAESDLNDSVL